MLHQHPAKLSGKGCRLHMSSTEANTTSNFGLDVLIATVCCVCIAQQLNLSRHRTTACCCSPAHQVTCVLQPRYCRPASLLSCSRLLYALPPSAAAASCWMALSFAATSSLYCPGTPSTPPVAASTVNALPSAGQTSKRGNTTHHTTHLLPALDFLFDWEMHVQDKLLSSHCCIGYCYPLAPAAAAHTPQQQAAGKPTQHRLCCYPVTPQQS